MACFKPWWPVKPIMTWQNTDDDLSNPIAFWLFLISCISLLTCPLHPHLSDAWRSLSSEQHISGRLQISTEQPIPFLLSFNFFLSFLIWIPDLLYPVFMFGSLLLCYLLLFPSLVCPMYSFHSTWFCPRLSDSRAANNILLVNFIYHNMFLVYCS